MQIGVPFIIDAPERAIIKAPMKVDDFDTLAGSVDIPFHVDDQHTIDARLEKASISCRRILDVISFATGRYLRVSIEEVFHGRNLYRATLLGKRPSPQPYKPPFNHLGLQDTLPVLLNGYTQQKIEDTGIDVAIEWHLMGHQYNEVRLLHQMTALEHLVSKFSEHNKSESAVLPQPMFKTLRRQMEESLPGLLQAIDPTGSVDHAAACKALFAALGNINRHSLRKKIDAMIVAYGVPLAGVDEEFNMLPDIRNSVVHTGLHQSRRSLDKPLGHYVAAAEEVVRRVILAILGFSGQYTSWFPDHHTTDFRPRPAGDSPRTS
jgi:hypothetical protein